MNREKGIGQSYYRALARKMFLTVTVFALTPMIFVSVFVLGEFHKSYRVKIYAHLGELVQKHKLNIDNFLKEKLNNIRFVATSFDFEQLSNAVFLQNKLIELQQEYGPVFEDMGVVDEHGDQVAYAGPFKLGKAKYADAQWFKNAIKNPYFISDVFLGLRGLPHFIVTARREYANGTWILRSTIDFVAFNNLVQNLRIGRTGFAFIINNDGEFQTKPLVMPTAVNPVNAQYFLEGAKEMKDGIHIVEKIEDSGATLIYVCAYLKDRDWLMVFRQDKADAFSELNNARNTAFLIIILGSLVIITMIFFVVTVMVGRLSEADREKELMNQQVIETGKLASIGELAAGIAHEINNPVAIMVEEAGWSLDLLEEEEFKESENLAEYIRALKQIQTQGKRCKEITHKLLSFARKTDAQTEEVVLNDLVEEIVELSAQRAKYGNVTIHCKLSNNIPPLHMSQTEIQQVLLNLINNALYAMEKQGGSMDITTCIEENDLIVEVADTGPGIPQANLQRIFDPFFTTKPVGKGTGLGLSICYGIVKKMGGKIDVQSIIGVGTTFRIVIPMEEVKPDASPEAMKPGCFHN